MILQITAFHDKSRLFHVQITASTLAITLIFLPTAAVTLLFGGGTWLPNVLQDNPRHPAPGMVWIGWTSRRVLYRVPYVHGAPCCQGKLKWINVWIFMFCRHVFETLHGKKGCHESLELNFGKYMASNWPTHSVHRLVLYKICKAKLTYSPSWWGSWKQVQGQPVSTIC